MIANRIAKNIHVKKHGLFGLTMIVAMMFCLHPVKAQAQPTVNTESDPVEITADGSLEWNRDAKTYTAVQNVTAKQGGVTLTSDKLVARYDDTGGATDITELVATGNPVTIASPPYTAFGEKAVYDVKTAVATLTGSNLKMQTATETLTARDSLQYFANENRLTATGNVVVIRANDRIEADLMTAFFKENPTTGRTELDKITATGNVVVKTARETAMGDNGTYDVSAQEAQLSGDVRILQGKNWLKGTRATVDLTTGISHLYAEGQNTGGQVRGVFYPNKNKE